jgi:hypothetical protein
LCSNGVLLAEALSADGAHVFGWDMEWNMNYNINRYTTEHPWMKEL